MRLPRLATAAAVVTALGLAGCVSLFPKADPAQLYRFGGSSVEAPEPAPPGRPGQRTAVTLSPVGFTQAASGDRILTFTGAEAAYVKDARWVSPAQTLFRESLDRAFRSAKTVHLVDRRQATGATVLLDLDVDTFEARYDNGAKAAPTVVMRVNARLIRFPDRAIVAERTFQSSKPAADNRMSAIVEAYDAAVSSVVGDLVAWTDTSV